MSERESKTIEVLSLLDGDLEASLRGELIGWSGVNYLRAEIPTDGVGVKDLLSNTFWSQLPRDAADVILVGLGRTELSDLRGMLASGSHRSGVGVWPWTRLSAAVVAVLSGVSLRDVESAGQLEFDGVLSVPFEREVIRERLEAARRRCGRRRYLMERYGKVRQLCRAVNRKRRHLRDKVDLLCRDLVNSNVQFAGTLRGLQRVYDFQSQLTGEYDLRYLLYKALRELRAETPDSSGAIYLCSSDNFEAHVAGVWYEDGSDIAEIEELFRATVVKKVIKTGDSLLVSEAGGWEEISVPQRSMLSGLTMLSLPVSYEGELLGVVVMYRQSSMVFSVRDRVLLEQMMWPFGQAIEAAQKLEHLVG